MEWEGGKEGGKVGGREGGEEKQREGCLLLRRAEPPRNNFMKFKIQENVADLGSGGAIGSLR